MDALRHLSKWLVLSVLVFAPLQCVLGFGGCDDDSGACQRFGNEEVHFSNKLTMERPKCKTSVTRQTLKLQWDPPGTYHATTAVTCFFFPNHIAENMADMSDAEDEDFNLFDSVLNFTAVLTSVKSSLWKCDVELTPGIWIPFLSYEQSQHPDQNGTRRWVFSESNLDARIVRPRIYAPHPVLLMADTKTNISIYGEFMESPAMCQVLPRNGHPSRPTHAIITDDSEASCLIEGAEGRATLLFTWGEGCGEEFEIEFLTWPAVTDVVPEVLPAHGNSTLDVFMKSGRPNVENEIALFLPSLQYVNPTARLSCLPDKTFKGAFSVISDNRWVSSFNISGLPSALRDAPCNVSLSLNDRDFYATERNLTIEGPFVRFLARKTAVIMGEETQLEVELERPVSVPVSVSLILYEPRNAHPATPLLRESTLTWSPGEMGVKHFVLHGKNIRKELVTLVAHLIQPVNCEIDTRSEFQDLLTLRKEMLPVFDVPAVRSLYPPSADGLKIDIHLISGSSKMDSVLAYEVFSQQLNEGCRGEGTTDLIPEMSGWLYWKRRQDQMTLEVPIHWENVDYCDEVEVRLKLRSIESASVKTAESTIAYVYGTPKGFCGPGTVHNRHEERTVPFNAGQDLSLADIKIEGRDSKSGEICQTALVPPFLAERQVYTAMVPQEMTGARLLLFNRGSPRDVQIADESCMIDENLSWKNAVTDETEMLLSEVDLGKYSQRCSLRVEGFDQVDPEAEIDTLDVEAPGSEIDDAIVSFADISPLEEPARDPTVFQIGFLKLSDPDVALLSSVEVRNATHVMTLCGQAEIPRHQASTEDGMFERIEGYPKHPCRIERINYVKEALLGSELYVIPRLLNPDVLSTRIEVSGHFMHGPDRLNSSSAVDLSRDSELTVVATAFKGVQMENASLSFDVRVTAEDSVTSNLYRFVYGRTDSVVDFYAAGSSFDMEHRQNKTDVLNNGTAVASSTHHSSGGRWCEMCPSGTFSIGVDALQCALCRPGHYADQPGRSYCESCPEGTYSYTWGSEMCRPCMFGSAANQKGAQYCQLCPEGYMTNREGAAHCTVPVESTDLHRYYAVIASFDVVLNGTSLEEIEHLGTSVRAPGVVVLKMLIRTDVAEALNVSVGDVAIKNVSPYGEHALFIDVDTTFKVEVPKDAELDEVHRKLKSTMLHGDEAVSKFANEPDKVFNRTRKATHARPKVNKNSAVYRESAPNEVRDTDGFDESLLFAPIICLCVLILACTYIIYSRFRQIRLRSAHAKPFAWAPLETRSESSSNESDTRAPSFGPVRHRPMGTRPVLEA